MNQSIIEILNKEHIGHHIALSDGMESWTYQKIIKEISNLKERLANTIEHGTLGVVVDQSISSILILLVLIELEVSFLPVDYKNTSSELLRLADEVGISIWIVPNGERMKKKRKTSYAVIDYKQFLSGAIDPVIVRHSNHQIRGLHQLTSGTNGKGKVAVIPYNAVYRGSYFYAQWFDFSPSDVMISSVPFSHNFGLVGALLSTLQGGSTLYVSNHNSARTLANYIRDYKGTVLFAVPLLYDLLVKSKNITNPSHLSSLRLAISSGSFLSEQLENQFLERFSIRISQIYGSTETGVIAAGHPDLSIPRGAVGRIIPDTQVSFSPDHRIKVKNNTLFSGYVQSKKFYPIDDLLDHDGFYVTEDIGVIQEQTLQIKGRTRKFIHIGSRNIDPAEITQVLLKHKAIAKARVYGERMDHINEKIIAYVQLQENISVDRIFRYLERELAPYKIPHEIKIVQEIPQSWKDSFKY